MRLAAGLCPDPLGKLEHSLITPSRNWGYLLLKVREGRGGKWRKGERMEVKEKDDLHPTFLRPWVECRGLPSGIWGGAHAANAFSKPRRAYKKLEQGGTLGFSRGALPPPLATGLTSCDVIDKNVKEAQDNVRCVSVTITGSCMTDSTSTQHIFWPF